MNKKYILFLLYLDLTVFHFTFTHSSYIHYIFFLPLHIPNKFKYRLVKTSLHSHDLVPCLLVRFLKSRLLLRSPEPEHVSRNGNLILIVGRRVVRIISSMYPPTRTHQNLFGIVLFITATFSVM